MAESTHVTQLNSENFKEEVTDFSGVVLVDYYAEWCTPCKMMAPFVDKLAQKFEDNPNVKVASVDVDAQQELASMYSVLSIPTFITFKNGEHVAERPGAMPPPELEKMITDHLDS